MNTLSQLDTHFMYITVNVGSNSVMEQKHVPRRPSNYITMDIFSQSMLFVWLSTWIFKIMFFGNFFIPTWIFYKMFFPQFFVEFPPGRQQRQNLQQQQRHSEQTFSNESRQVSKLFKRSQSEIVKV